ncbi:MAG: alpha-2-macroglobulin family protein, partial [Rhizobiaceae bacterium]|nr:alpha-2-macroglobulin family protein [Rhizobiaceae bacterium]
RDDLGQPVWSGKIDLKKIQNREAVTSFPVDEALPKREPGIYVLTALPSGEEGERWENRATQWFLISDIGLSTIKGEDGLSVFSRSLESAAPIANLELTLIARNNEILGTATTDEKGMAKFPVGLVRGKSGLAPAVLIAKNSDNQSDFVFLDMKKNAFDLSDRGVEGRAAPGPIDVFLYHDRGIYRTGETVNTVALMRDDKADAVLNVPLTFIYRRPDGVEDRRIVSRSGSIGGHVVQFKLTDNAMRGQWNLSVYTDPKKTALSRKSFLVEDFIPDRTEFELTSTTTRFSESIPADISLDGKFLYGAPASELKLEGDIRASMVRTREGFSGYQFGLGDETNSGGSVFALADLPKTDVDGHAEFKAYLGTLPATTRPIEASITVRMREEGGRAIERQISLPVLANGPMIGVHMNFEDGGLSQNSVAEFDVIAIDPDGAKINLLGLYWSLYKIERNYQWYRNGGNWRYESVTIPRLVGNGTVDAGSGGVAKISASVKWGLYRLEVESSEDDGPATSVEFSAGWYFDGGSVDTPDALEIAFDREHYAVGDKATLTITPQFAGEMLVAIGSDQLHETLTLNVPRSGTKIEIPVKAEWGSGAYVTTILVRPGGYGSSSRLPTRAIGTAWLQIDPGKRKLDVKLDLPEKTKPNETLSIPVSIAGLTAGEQAYVSVAAVDVGILNLTRYTPPEPSKWYHGQRAMGLEIRDIYGRLIDGSQGAFGKLRTGGDASDLRPKGSPPTQKLFSFFSGAVKVDAEGKATIDFELPQFNGTARIMAVAWTDKGVGSANGDVIVRDAVVVTASVPKVLAPGDVAESVVEITNTDGPAGNYVLSLEANDVISIDDSAIPAFVNLAPGERKSFRVPITANRPGTISMTLNVVFDAETVSSVVQEVFVRPSTLPITKRNEFKLVADGGKVAIDKDLLLGSIPQGASVSINVSSSSAFDLPGLLMKLDRYPYGCAEQTTSRALPLLYLSDFGASDGLIDAADVKKRVAGAITRVLSYQSSSGSFGLWRPDSGDLWLDSYITDFLTRASEKGFKVPEIGMRLAVDNLKNSLSYTNDISDNGNEIAYALYVLARNRAASTGDLRYYADTRLKDFATPLARAHLAAALSLYNDVERANRVFGSAYNLAENAAAISFVRSDYGSALRDSAAMLALASESRPVSPLVGKMVRLVAKELDLRTHTSTQENAWMLLAARALQEENASIRLDVNGGAQQGAYTAKFTGDELAGNPITVTNKMGHNLVAVVSTIASPERPLSAGGDGFAIERHYYRLDGTETTLNDVTQNERFLVVVKFNQDNPWGSRVVLTDLLPGGFEIDNPRLVTSAKISGFDWLDNATPAHTEFRKDRFVVAFNHSSDDKRWHTAAYMVRAVTPGTYVLPAASVEDMYRPQFQARTATGFITIKAVR